MAIVSCEAPNGKRVEAEVQLDAVDRTIEAIEAGKQVRAVVKAEQAVKAAKKVVEKTEKKVKVKVENVVDAEAKPKRGKGANNPNRVRALEIIRSLKEQGVTEQKTIIKAIMDDLKLEKSQQALAWYYVNKIGRAHV